MQKAGSYLRSVREEKGFTLQEVSKATKISAPVLRALEEGRIDNVDPIYLKGFLKLYCRYLGLDWEGFISEHPIPELAKKQQKPPAVKPSARGKNIPAGTAHCAAPKKRGVSFIELISANNKFIAIILAAIAVLLLAALIFKGVVFIAKKLPKFELPPKTSVSVKTSKESPAKKNVVIPAPAKKVAIPLAKEPAKETQSPPKDPSKTSKPKEVTLAIRAQEDSFLTVKVDGKIVYQRMMYKGKAETWSAKTKIELSVGNAGGLMLEVNGKPIPSLGKKGQQIKNILINSDGLKAL